MSKYGDPALNSHELATVFLFLSSNTQKSFPGFLCLFLQFFPDEEKNGITRGGKDARADSTATGKCPGAWGESLLPSSNPKGRRITKHS
jgi:hypothetical protein